MTVAVELRDLFRVHSTPEGDAAALQGLSLNVRDREVVGVLGPSGSGKSTLLRIVAALDRPSAGTARVFGLDLPKLSDRRRAEYRRSQLGYADQHYSRALAPELRARDQIALAASLRGATRGERLRRADELLEKVGLADRAAAYPAELSGGEQQRVAVASAVAHRPRLFLADEPTGELDAANARLVYDLIGDLVRDEGCTALIVSHDPGSEQVADRIVHIRDGRLAAEATRAAGGEEEIVVGRGGWLRVPEEYLLRAGIGSHAVARLEAGAVVLSAAGSEKAGASPEAASLGPAHAAGVVAEARGVTRRFGATDVLVDVNGSFAGGRLYAVTGPSGSGKTTLLHLLAGLDTPDAGEIVVCSETLSALDRESRARVRAKEIGFVAQQPALIGFLSSRENVELGLAVRGRSDTERATETLVLVGLAERVTQRVSRLSMGERARVAIARALAGSPSLLLADEPTSRLDEANSRAIAVLLARLARETGTAVVCATHDPVVIDQADEVLSLAP